MLNAIRLLGDVGFGLFRIENTVPIPNGMICRDTKITYLLTYYPFFQKYKLIWLSQSFFGLPLCSMTSRQIPSLPTGIVASFLPNSLSTPFSSLITLLVILQMCGPKNNFFKSSSKRQLYIHFSPPLLLNVFTV
jgi:hypothetical protein